MSAGGIMTRTKHSSDLIEQVLKDLESTNDLGLVSRKHGVPTHAFYRFRRERLKGPEVSKDKKIKELSQELADKDLENKILRELKKETNQVMPIKLS
jgi:transposase-like protein